MLCVLIHTETLPPLENSYVLFYNWNAVSQVAVCFCLLVFFNSAVIFISLKHPMDANKTHSLGIAISKQGRVVANMEVSVFLRKEIVGCVSHLLIFLVPF